MCARCGGRRCWLISTRPERRRCASCRSEVSLRSGTLLADSRVPLGVWLRAVWLVSSQKRGVSALDLQRLLGLGSYETAWTMLHKLRRAMRPTSGLLYGVVEIDETYIGGPDARSQGRRQANKAIVAIAVEKHEPKGLGRARLERIADVSADTLTEFVQRNVAPQLPRRTRPALRDDPRDRRLARLRPPRRRRLPARADQPQPDARPQGRAPGAARLPPRRRAAQALAARHPPGRRRSRTARRLPRRVRVPLQPPILAQHRPALPPPAHKHAVDPAEAVQDPHRDTDRATRPVALQVRQGDSRTDPANGYGPGGTRTHALEIKVRPNELRRTAGNGNVLQLARIGTATNCSEMRDVETTLYARSYARSASREATHCQTLGYRGPARSL